MMNSTDTRPANCLVGFLVTIAVYIFCSAPVVSQQLYQYRDESGQLVFSDRRPPGQTEFETAKLDRATLDPPEVAFRREQSGNTIELWANNPCYCPAEIVVQANSSALVNAKPANTIQQVVPARSETLLMQVESNGASVDFKTGAIFGDPDRQHQSNRAYRPPFAAGREFLVSQAYPDAITHVTPDSRHAIDIAMPEQTAVYAARGGIVVEVAHSNFRGGADFGKYGAEANLVKVMHDDGSFAIYAHLSWDSIRVRPGDAIARGEQIATSGNTGFSTGPHLHFVVVRNAGLRLESVPISFAGRGGVAVRPATGKNLASP